MLKSALYALVFLLLAVVGGAVSVWYMLELSPVFAQVSSGPWIAFPLTGSPDADPYSKARHARIGGLPLGRAEGIILTASSDTAGKPLHPWCSYQISGGIENARFWSIHATDIEGSFLKPVGRIKTSVNSQNLIWDDEDFLITLSRNPMPGNWMPISGEEPFHLLLTLFDTPLITSAELSELRLPKIIRMSCND